MKHLITTGIALAVMSFVAACSANRAVTRDPTQADLDRIAAEYNAKIDDPAEHVVCTREAEVGTRFKEVKCRKKWQAEWEQKEARRYATKPRPVPTQ